jgi:hypothetical protein
MLSTKGICPNRTGAVGSLAFPARETMAALWQAKVLDEVIETKEGLVVYPAELEAESAWVSNGNDVWQARNGR